MPTDVGLEGFAPFRHMCLPDVGLLLFGANAWYFVLLPAFHVAVVVPLRGCASVLRVNDSC